MDYFLLVAYDGTAYQGWQRQPFKNTIEGALMASFSSVFCQDARIRGASRTDSGVHALGQVVHVRTDLELEPARVLAAWNASLPRDILIRAVRASPENFSPQAGVLQKTYYYQFFVARPLPFLARYGAVWYRSLDFALLEEGLRVFVGTHDFRSFCTGDEQELTVRTIDSIQLEYIKRYKMFRIIVRGPSFLRYMIRRIVGAAYDCAVHRCSPRHLVEALAACNPQQHFATAQPEGLILRKIHYKNVTWHEESERKI